MNAALSLPDLQARGVQLWAEGETLRYRAPAGTVTPELLANLQAHKPELLKALGKRQSLEQAAADACRGLTGYISPDALMAKLAPEDVRELETCPDPLPFLRSFAIALVWTTFRRDGIAPPGWDQPAHCDRCGPVLLWTSIDVAGCPWCWNRLHGVKIPRPHDAERGSAA